ncbi:hypothetical protein [Vulcanisaeta sp. JCM 16159]|uniref:hypothetical protein n=1 Tax=Vulcanisaeta sp. JCM 16159 TaxID=1295371 RepID=UPI0034660C57
MLLIELTASNSNVVVYLPGPRLWPLLNGLLSGLVELPTDLHGVPTDQFNALPQEPLGKFKVNLRSLTSRFNTL